MNKRPAVQARVRAFCRQGARSVAAQGHWLADGCEGRPKPCAVARTNGTGNANGGVCTPEHTRARRGHGGQSSAAQSNERNALKTKEHVATLGVSEPCRPAQQQQAQLAAAGAIGGAVQQRCRLCAVASARLICHVCQFARGRPSAPSLHAGGLAPPSHRSTGPLALGRVRFIQSRQSG